MAKQTLTTTHNDVSEHGLSLVLITAAVLAATLMQKLDTTIVSVALPGDSGKHRRDA